MYKLKSINELITEENRIQKIRRELAKAESKIDSFKTKSRAASEQANFRKEELDYVQKKQKLQNNIESAQSKVDKAKLKEKLSELRGDWKKSKEKMKDRIKNLHQSARSERK